VAIVSLKSVRLIALALACAASYSVASAQVVLRYSPWLPPKHTINEEVLRPWGQEVERVTAGRVKLEFLPKAVGTPPTQFDVVRAGMADVGVVLPGYNPGRFPTLDMGEMPLLSSETAVLAPAFYRAYVKHLEPSKPFRGTHVLTIFATTPTQIVSRQGPIKKIADLKGMKLRSPGALGVKIMEELGAVPILKPVSELYELSSTGVIDGTFISATAVKDWNLGKALPHITLVPGGMGQPVMAFLVNEAKWNTISAADRKAIMDVSGEKLAGIAGKKYGDAELRARASLSVAGVNINDGGPALAAELQKRLMKIEQEWAVKAKEAGMADPLKALAELRASVK